MSKKILICDEDEKVRVSLKMNLGDHYELIIVDSGAQAMHVLNNSKDISVALFDIKLQKELLTEVKASHPALKIIMVTGYKSVETTVASSKRNISGYIVKPFKSEEILEIVRNNLK